MKVSDWSLPIDKDITADFVISEAILALAVNDEIQPGLTNVHCSVVPGPFAAYLVKRAFYECKSEGFSQYRGSFRSCLWFQNDDDDHGYDCDCTSDEGVRVGCAH